VADFNFKNRARDRRHPYCRACQQAWNRQHYQRRRDAYIANARRHNLEYKAANLTRLVEYLMRHACVDCGETDIVVLHFDHRDRADKIIEVGRLMSRYSSWPQIAAEIAKCEVRCANCHQRRTAQQFGWRKTRFRRAGCSRGGGTRTPDIRFWRSALYQLSYAPELSGCSGTLYHWPTWSRDVRCASCTAGRTSARRSDLDRFSCSSGYGSCAPDSPGTPA